MAITFETTFSGRYTNSLGVDCDWDLDIEITYEHVHEDEIEIEEVTHDGDPISPSLYDRHEEKIYDLALEHMFTEDAAGQHFGARADRAYDEWRERQWT